MSAPINYIEINRQSWNKRVAPHLQSEFYGHESFLKGRNTLNDIELQLLGDIAGKDILHLQCHFGQDTISLERLGASVTGVDLSDKAIESAIEISKTLGSNASFICCDIYALPQFLAKKFDVVFTSYGTIGWLPDLNKWAQIIAKFLNPGGQLVFVDFHPVLGMFDNNFNRIDYSYFNIGAIMETETGTYANKEAALTQDYVMWNHGIGEVLNSLIQNGLEIHLFNEYDYSPYKCFDNLIAFEANKYRVQHHGNKIPMVYAIVATKKQ